MISTVRFRGNDEYFKIGEIIFRRPAPDSPDMEKFRQRFFEMTGEPYDLYEARMAAAKEEESKKGTIRRALNWFFGLFGPSTPIVLRKNPPNGTKNTDNHPENRG